MKQYLLINKLTGYFLSDHYVVKNRLYYFKLSVIIALSLTVFVYAFDPYDNYLALTRYNIPRKLIQLGYGINIGVIVYLFHWIVFRKWGFAGTKKQWKTYHHWLSFVFICIVSGFSGTVYHRLVMVVEQVDVNYYTFVTIPRTILIGLTLFIVSILYDKLSEKKEHSEKKENRNVGVGIVACSGSHLVLRSPVINQQIELIPQDIIYLKTCRNYVEIYLKNQKKPILIRASLNCIIEQLHDYTFIKKCHRQYCVNLNLVTSFKGNSQNLKLLLQDFLLQIPVSKSHVLEILSFLKK